MLDYLKSNIRKSRVNSHVIKIINSDVSETKIPDNSIDLVIIANVLHDVENKPKLLEEVKRISKSRARMADIDWVAKETPFGPPQDIRLDEPRARAILESGGFTIRKKIDAGPYHYGLLCEFR
jgi:ubiquinone/menaquinone biosynthesis C-methylase UbiE